MNDIVNLDNYNQTDDDAVVTSSEVIDDDLCDRMRKHREQGLEYVEIAEKTDTHVWNVLPHILGECETCSDDSDAEHDPNTPALDNDKPWREESLLEELFIVENLDFTRIADQVGCHNETVRNWIDKYDIAILDPEDRTSSPTVRLLTRLGEQQKQEANDDIPDAARQRPLDHLIQD